MEAQTAFLKKCSESNLVPIPHGFVNYKGHEEEINLRNYGMGDDYVTAFAKGLKISNTIRKVNLADNRLNEKGTIQVVKALNKYVQEVDLSENRVGNQTIEEISKMIRTAS